MEILMFLAVPLMLLGGFALDAATHDDGDNDRVEDDDPADRDPIL